MKVTRGRGDLARKAVGSIVVHHLPLPFIATKVHGTAVKTQYYYFMPVNLLDLCYSVIGVYENSAETKAIIVQKLVTLVTDHSEL